MSLPALLVLTDRSACRHSLGRTLAAAVDGGARAVVLRERDLPDDARLRLAEQVAALLAPVDGVLLVAGTLQAGRGNHLAARDPVPSPRPGLLGRSCHDPDELSRAGAEGCDWVTLSPVAATPSKPGYGPPLGRDGLAALAARAGALPVYALGGVTPSAVPDLLAAGARGVAVMGPVMRAEDPGAVVQALLAELDKG